MHTSPFDSSLTPGEVEVMLDGFAVGVPSSRRSLTAIRSYLETLALERQRILCSFTVDGQPADLNQPLNTRQIFHHVEAESIDLDEMPLQLLKTANQQAAAARTELESAVAVVIINEGRMAREFWWDLAKLLKEPLLTLSLLSNDSCGPANGRASLSQLRKWQLQQLAAIIRDVDEACQIEDTIALSNALETRVIPWLGHLQELIKLWKDTVAAGTRLAACA